MAIGAIFVLIALLGTLSSIHSDILTSLEEERMLKLNSLTKKCGELTTDRIGGGEDAEIGEFPWMVLLARNHPPKTFDFYCGGSLISNRYVLTAAHCIPAGNTTVKSVRLGDHDFKRKKDCFEASLGKEECNSPIDIAVESFMIHKDYDSTTYKTDIALIRLAEDVNYTKFIQPICLPEIKFDIKPRKVLKLAGWGITDPTKRNLNSILQKGKFRYVDTNTCNETVAPHKRPITDNEICAKGDVEEDACKGDSGGPLMFYTAVTKTATPKMYQVGIVSTGTGGACGGSQEPSIYTKVSGYLDWILDNMSIN